MQRPNIELYHSELDATTRVSPKAVPAHLALGWIPTSGTYFAADDFVGDEEDEDELLLHLDLSYTAPVGGDPYTPQEEEE